MDHVSEHLAAHRRLARGTGRMSLEQIQRSIDQQVALHRAQFVPLPNPSLCERLKRWWYSR